MADVRQPVRERAVRFGKSATLVGVQTLPVQPAGAPSLPAALLLNSGILHHVGACRLHVQIARALARDGFPVLRFDHSGIGDSEPRRDALPFAQSAPLEVQEAMTFLTERHGAERFVLIGLCSGADMAFNVALIDERVDGIVQMDAYAYRTLMYYVHYYAPRMMRIGSWRAFMNRQVRALLASSKNEGSDTANDEFVSPEYRRVFPPQQQVAEGLQSLVDRNVRLFNIFTGGQQQHFNHHGQYRRSFRSVDFRDLLRVEYMPTAAHTFTNLEHQKRVTGMIREWCGEHWKAAPSLPYQAHQTATRAG